MFFDFGGIKSYGAEFMFYRGKFMPSRCSALLKYSQMLSSLRTAIFLVPCLILFATAARADTTFISSLDGYQQVPSNSSSAAGTGTVILNSAENQVTVTLFLAGLTNTETTASVQLAPRGNSGPSVFSLPIGNFSQSFAVTAEQVADLKNGSWYFNVGTVGFPLGELRGQIELPAAYNPVAFPFSNGALDATFGSGGTLITPVGSLNAVAQAVAIQPDGKIVAAGYSFNGAKNDFAVVRYNPDGTLDTTFDGDGIATAGVGGFDDEAFAVALQPDGKIIVGGETSNGANFDIALVRFNSNGSLDPTFDGDGIVKTAVGPANDLIRSIAVQPNGKILVAGNASNGTNSDLVVVRYESNGSLDTGFDGNSGSGNGIVTTPVGTGNEIGYSVAVQPDGRIVVAGYYAAVSSTDPAIVRYETDGRLDTTFGNGGIVTPSFSPGTDEALAMTLQNDGKIVIAGCIQNGGPNDYLIARFNPNGSLDTAFGTGGRTIVPFSPSVDIALGVAIQSDGKIVAAGFASNGSDNDFGIVRLNADGIPDGSFGSGGRRLTPLASSDNANAVAIQEDGRIVAAGRTFVGSIGEFALIRYGYGTNSTVNDGFFSLNTGTEVRYDNGYRSGASSVTMVNSAALPPLPSGMNYIGTPRTVNTSALFSGNAVVKLTLPIGIDAASFNSAQILQFENGLWVDKTTAQPARDFGSRVLYARISVSSPIAIVTPTTQPVRAVSVSGRLLTANGKAVASSLVTATNQIGGRIYAVANPFGYYQFAGLLTGGNYIINIASKRSRFAPRAISVNDDLANIDLISQ